MKPQPSAVSVEAELRQYLITEALPRGLELLAAAVAGAGAIWLISDSIALEWIEALTMMPQSQLTLINGSLAGASFLILAGITLRDRLRGILNW